MVYRLQFEKLIFFYQYKMNKNLKHFTGRCELLKHVIYGGIPKGYKMLQYLYGDDCATKVTIGYIQFGEFKAVCDLNVFKICKLDFSEGLYRWEWLYENWPPLLNAKNNLGILLKNFATSESTMVQNLIYKIVKCTGVSMAYRFKNYVVGVKEIRYHHNKESC
jgi:hypothetical protein